MLPTPWTLWLAVVLALAGAGPAAAQFVGEEAPRFKGADLEGRPIDAAMVIGKQPVLLVFWVSW